MALYTELFTKELTNDTLTITSGMGVLAVSVFCSSATSGTVTGTKTLQGIASSSLTVEQNQTITITSTDGGTPISGVVIDAPSGCTLQVMAQI